MIQRYSELHSQGRMEALDAMEAVVQELGTQKGRKEAKHHAANEEFRINVMLDVLKVRVQNGLV